MEPLHDSNEGAPRPAVYTPKRSRWPGLLGAAAIVAAVLGVAMWMQHDDAPTAKAPVDPAANATAPAQPDAGAANRAAGATGTTAGNVTPGLAPGDDSKVATQPPPARR